MSDPAATPGQPPPTDEALLAAIDMIERVALDRGLLAGVTEADRKRIIQASERIARPDRRSRKRLLREFKNREQAQLAEHKAVDEQKLARTGIRTQPGSRYYKKPCPPAPFATELPPAGQRDREQFIDRLEVARSCYICNRWTRSMPQPGSAIRSSPAF